MVDAAEPDEGAETAAARFVAWLAHTRRPWALILDDLAELSDLDELWPAGPAGPGPDHHQAARPRVRPAAGRRRAADGTDLRVVPVPGLSRREALDYLTSRLTDYPDQRIEALDLGEDLDGLPLALAQAAAVMTPATGRAAGSTAAAGRAARAHARDPGRRRLRRRAGHLVAGRGVRARAAAGRAGLAGPGAGRHARPPRHPRRRADQPGRLRLRRRAAERRRTRRTRPWSARPSTTWPGPAWSPSTRPARCAPCRCTPACRPRCGPTCRPPTWSRSCWPPRTRCCRPGRNGRDQAGPGPGRAGPAHQRSARSGLRDCAAALRSADGAAPPRPAARSAARSLTEPAVEAGGPPAAVPRRASLERERAVRGRPSRTGSPWWPPAPGCSARPTPTPWWPGTGWPRPTRRPGGPPTPSRCSRPR